MRPQEMAEAPKDECLKDWDLPVHLCLSTLETGLAPTGP